MKAIVRFGFFLLFLAGIALVMLQGREMARQNLPGGGADMTGHEWRPIVLGAEILPADSGMHVVFAVDGSINGNGGCNNFFGALEKTEGGIKVGELGATRMACPETVMDREGAYLQALQRTSRFELGDQRLQLLDANNQLLLEFVAED
ncbi:MAG: META domain-containing protein [Proteobacteria bacterium]|nr:META domain-containing protein [Pseudomonadota bacterium]MDA1062878.1 META domain-containing protein [Pseudomonadota bacterium]